MHNPFLLVAKRLSFAVTTHPLFHSKLLGSLIILLGCVSSFEQKVYILGDWFVWIDCILALGRAFFWNQGYHFFPPEATCLVYRAMIGIYVLGTTATTTVWDITKIIWVVTYLLCLLIALATLMNGYYLMYTINAETRELFLPDQIETKHETRIGVTSRREQSEVCNVNSLRYQKECVICWDELGGGEIVTRLNCNHVLHTQCLEKWSKYNACCPLCMT